MGGLGRLQLMPMPDISSLIAMPKTDTCRLTPAMPPTLETLGSLNRVHLASTDQLHAVADSNAMNHALHRSRGVAVS